MSSKIPLIDFLDEEVVDKYGITVGTLACFWESVRGRAAYYGEKIASHSIPAVVPAQFSTQDDYNCCIHLGFDATEVKSAPGWDCSMELDAYLQEKVCKHFGLGSEEICSALKHYSRPERSVQTLGDGEDIKGR